MTATKEDFFKPGKLSSQEKATATNQAVAQILAAETASRLKKTDRLREARLARDAETVIVTPAERATKKPRAAKR